MFLSIQPHSFPLMWLLLGDEKIMIRSSVVGVRGRSGKRRVIKNGQAMNQFVQVTPLGVTSSCMEIKFIQTIRVP